MLMQTKAAPALGELVIAQDVATHFPIALENLSFRTPHKSIIKDISASFQDVQCTAVIGHNGAGKSVLLRLLHGLLKPTSGTISWGSQLADSGRGKPQLWQAMVFQKPVLLNRSVAANLAFVLRRQGLRGAACDRAVNEYLSLAGLDNAAQRPAKVLSGGEAQCLAIVRALATSPHLLFLDEPTASLDPLAKSRVEELLKKIMCEGVRLILVTQDVGQAARLAKMIAVMHQGEIVETGTVGQVLNAPESAEASAFLKHQI